MHSYCKKSQYVAKMKNIIFCKIPFFLSTASVGAWVLFISTDYIFDGTKPPYKVTDEPNPLNKYGVSKLEGEKVTLQVSEGKKTTLLYNYKYQNI